MRVNHFMRCSVLMLLVGVLAATATSCADNKSATGVNGVSADEAALLNGERSEFARTEKDPPLSANTHFAAAQLAESQGAVEQAISQYQAALKVNPQHELSIYRLGVIYTQLKQYPLAIQMWQRYVSVTRGTAIGYSNLGFCYEVSGNLAEAEKCYQAGIARDPKCEPCRVNYGLMLARTDRLNQALLELQAVMKPAEAHYDIGSVLEQIGKKEQAKEAYNKALEIDPNFIEARKRLAAIN